MAAAAGLRQLLAERDFALLIGAQLIAQSADGIAQAAFADALILQPEGTPTRILFLFAVTLVPYSLLSPFLGVFVDRWSRRGLLVWSNLLRAALLITLPLWHPIVPGDAGLFVSVLVLLGFGRLFLTTKGAALAVTLRERRLLQGNAVSGGGGMIAALLGGVVGIGFALVVGTEATFVIAGGIYAIAAVMARTLSDPMSHEETRALGRALARVAHDLIAGIGAIYRRPAARVPLAAIFVLRVIAMFVAVIAILIIKTHFPEAGDRFGKLSSGALALGAAGAGAFVGAVFAPPLGRRFRRPGLIMLGFLVSGASLVAFGWVVSLQAVFALTFVGGFGSFIAKIAVDTQVQQALPDVYRGRAFALYDILYNVASVAAAALVVAFQPPPFKGPILLTGAASFALAGAVAWAMRRAGMFSAGPVSEPAA